MSTVEVLNDSQSTATEVVPSVSIENMVNMRAAAIERCMNAVKLLREAQEIIRTAKLGEVRIEMKTSERSDSSIFENDAPELIRQEIDRGAWRYLMNESGMRTFMDATARKAWDEQLYKGVVPELTLENIEATFKTLHAQRGDMFERGVIACFQRLSWDYKTNQPFKFGKRIILGYLFSVYGSGPSRWLSLNHRSCDELDDLLRVFRVLDGKPQPDHRQGTWQKISEAERDKKDECDMEYFHVRWFRKGSGHLTFKRLDLVDRLNAILAKHYPRALAADR